MLSVSAPGLDHVQGEHRPTGAWGLWGWAVPRKGSLRGEPEAAERCGCLVYAEPVRTHGPVQSWPVEAASGGSGGLHIFCAPTGRGVVELGKGLPAYIEDAGAFVDSYGLY